jgi:diguanylate cyclase (GGDEF)-like protein
LGEKRKGVPVMQIQDTRKSLKNKLAYYFKIPEKIRSAFLEETVRKNDFSMVVICIIIFVVEFYNLFRVLFLSRSGLGTLNNRIYFSLYCCLILIAAAWPVLHRALRHASAKAQWRAQFLITSLMLLWHVSLNAYDLYRDPNAGTTVLATALLGIAFLILSSPLYIFIQFGMAYLLFWVVLAPSLDAGDRLNLTITFLVAVAVSLASVHHTAIRLQQQKEIIDINVKLQKLAEIDPLTSLLNKTTVEFRAKQSLGEMAQADATGSEKPEGVTLFLLDLDAFKMINDVYGHPCGDYVLVETAEGLRTAFSDALAIGRIGGDEFAVLYHTSLANADIDALCVRLRQQLAKIHWQEKPMYVSCSIGVCVCSDSERTYHQLYAETDRMLYLAKKAGKNQCHITSLQKEESI